MTTSLLSLLAYVLISTFTPGPSNISSASLAVVHGFKQTLTYQLGLAVGVFLIMLLSGWFSAALLGFFPVLEPVLRYVGAAYILYLAFGILKASYTFTHEQVKPLGFVHGLMLQVLNPKLMVYAFTLFSAFFAPMSNMSVRLGLVAALLAAISFVATAVWAMGGMAIQRFLRQPRLKTMVNILLALSLVYTAITLMELV